MPRRRCSNSCPCRLPRDGFLHSLVNPLLELNDVRCAYDGATVVNGMSFSVQEGELACLLGPSGCGKTTVMRAIAGLEPIQTGTIRIAGQQVSTPDYQLAPEHRQVGMVFQDYALFPQMSVGRNIGFGLKDRRERATRVRELLQVVGLDGLADRYPHELSGGQQQRVALARALAPHPKMILMDEPFSGLDVDLRERVGAEVRDILRRQGITGILVTHDQYEAFALGDRIGVINHGRLLQWDTAYRLYHQPGDRFVADFIGQGTFIPATVITPSTVETPLGIIRGKAPCACEVGERVEILLRPDDIVHDDDSPLRAEVVARAFKGAEILVTLRTGEGIQLLSLSQPSQSWYR